MAVYGPVLAAHTAGPRPTIWLAGTPEDLKEWMALVIAGIVTYKNGREQSRGRQ